MIDDIIKKVVTPIVPICVPHRYTGDEATYAVYRYTEIPINYGDDLPHAVRYLVQLHLYLPLNVAPHAIKRRLRRAIAAVEDFTAPQIVDASDDQGQHYSFEFEAVDGGDLDGNV